MSANDTPQKESNQLKKDISASQLYELLLEANQKQTNELKTEIQINIKVITNTIEIQNKELENVKRNCISLERRNRKNNIVIFGIENTQDKPNLLINTLTLINELLVTNVKEEDINNIYTLGNKSNSPVVLEFISFLKKITLFKNTENLRKLKEKGISISNDLCYEDREELKILRKHLKLARAQNLEASIKGFKLLINNKIYTVEDLKTIEQNRESDIGSSVGSGSEESAEETEDEEEKNQATTSQTEKHSKESQPQVEKKTAASKRKRSKVFIYSPKKHNKKIITRSQITNKK